MNNLYRHRSFPILILALHLTLFGVVVYFMDYYTKPAIAQLLQTWIVRGLGLNFFLILVALIPCLKDIRRAFSGLKRNTLLWLAVVTVGGTILCGTLVPTEHRIYYDEDIYANIGQTIAVAGKSAMCTYGTFEYGEYQPHALLYNKEPSGWPYLMSVVFRLIGVEESYIFRLNNLLFGASILVCFFLTRIIVRDHRGALAAALVFALTPHALMWSNTLATETPAMLMAGLCILTAAVFFEHGRLRHFVLLALLLPFSSQIRPEGLLIVFVVLAAFALFRPRLLADRQLWMLALLIHLFIVPHLLHLYAMSGYDWGAGGAKFATGFFQANLSVNGPYFFINKEFPLVFTLLALCGLFWGKTAGRWRTAMALWFLAFWGIFLFFYAGSYHYGADDRFALLVFLPLSVLAGIGVSRMTAAAGRRDPRHRFFAASVAVLLIAFGGAQFFPMVRVEGQEAWAARYDHTHAKVFLEHIPERSMVVTHVPDMFLLWGQNAISIHSAIDNPDLIQSLSDQYFGHIYFHRNYWCQAKAVTSSRACSEIARQYELTPVVTAQEQDYTYGLYQMRRRMTDDR